MMKYKDVDKKIDEALKLAKEDGKNHGFDLCQSGAEITLSKVDSNENNCPGTKLGSFQAIPSPADITNIQPDVQKV
jgi:hypothetical protein